MKNKIFILALVLLFGVFAVNAQTKASKQFVEKAEKEISTPEIADRCPNVSSIANISTKATWDVLFSFNTQNSGEQAVGTDGQFFYTAKWQTDGLIGKYGPTGTFIEDLTITGVAAGIRDFCTDGTYFYARGGASASSIYKIDFATNTLVSTITSAVAIRHMSYDPTLDGGNGGFWVGDFATLTKIKMDGSLIEDITGLPAAWEGVYGTAYDDVSEGGPFLWVFNQDATDPKVDILKYDIATNTVVETYDAGVATGVEPAAIAGGIDGSTELVPGKFVLVANFQQDPNFIVVFDVAVAAPATAPNVSTELIAVAEPAGALTADISWNNPALDVAGDALAELTSVSLYDADDMTTPIYTNAAPVMGDPETYSATVAAAGNYTFTVIGSNSAGDGLPTSVSVYIGEDVPGTPTNVVLAKDEMEAQLSWEAPTVGLQGGFFDGTGVTYDVYRFPGNVQVATAQSGTTFTETLTIAGNYSYNVVASNAIGLGGNATSNVLLFGNFLVYEMFDEAAIPDGWTAQGLGLENWSVAATVVAGGDANELRFYWNPSFTGASYFVSPVINTVGMDRLRLNYKDMFNDYNTTPKTIGVKTTIDGGATWLVANEEIMTNGNVDVGPRDNTVTIENEHVGSPDFQFAFFYDGYTFDIDGWNLDNIELINLAGANVTFTVKEGTDFLEGATVAINAGNYTTAADGTVTAYVLEGTDIPYTVTKLGWGDVTGTITVVDGVDQDVAVEMVSLPTYEVTFNIMDVDSEPLDALVTIELAGNAVANEVATGGTVMFSGIPDGDYTYTVTMPLYLPAIGSFEVTGANVIVPDVMLTYDPEIVIGTGAVTGQACPVNGYFGYTYSQSIYLKSEIANMPMTVTHVKYYFNGTSLSNSNDWTIYMGHTDKSEFASATDWLPMAELTEVYSEVFTSPTAAGWIEFDITDFDYNGVDNLVIAVDENTSGYNSFSDRFLNSVVAGNRSVAKFSDSENPDPNNPGEGNYIDAFIPNTILTAYPKPGANVNFSVIDGTNPVEDAVIVVDAKTFTTLADGTVTAYVGEGTDVPYTVNKFGYEQYDGTITVVDGVDQDVDITMVALPTYSVTVNIKNILNEPLDAMFTVYFDGVEIVSETAVAGEIVATDVPVGTYTYDVVFEGYTSIIGETVVVDGDEVLTVELLEIFVEPYGLLIDVDDVEKTALFSWNTGDFSFADSFEDGTFDAWSEYIQGSGTPGTDGPNPYWYVTNDPGGAAADGTKICFSDWGYGIDTWIISEDLVVTETTTLSFWWNTSYHWSVDPNNNGDVLVKISTNGGADWTTLWTEDDEDVFENFTWYETVLDLSGYVGIVKIAFNYVSDDGATYSIDNILFTDVQRKAGTVAVSNTPNVPVNAKTAKGANYAFSKPSKAFVDYTIYLDDMTTPYQENVQGTSIEFTGLALGNHTAGVKRVYETGASEIVTIDFAIADDYTVTFNVSEARGPIEGANININGTNLTTDAAGVATIDLLDGTYDFTVTAAGFGDYTDQVVVAGADVPVNVALIGMGDVAANFSIYPNPTTGILNVQADGTNNIVILNAIGQVVHAKVLNGNGTIDLSNNAAGVYFVRFQSGDNVATQRIILE